MVPIAPSATTTRLARASRSDPRPCVGWGDALDAMIGKPTYRPAGHPTAHYGDGMLSPTTTDRVATAPGVEVVVTTHGGESAGVPVLLLHGLSQQRAFWGPVVRRLRSRPVAAMDQRGHGETDTPLDRDFSVSACAADVVAVLDQPGLAARGRRGALVGRVRRARGGGLGARPGGRRGARGRRAVVPVRARSAGTGPRGAHPAGPGHAGGRALGPGSAVATSGPWWSDEVQDALAPTFRTDADGLVRTRLGMDRHMKVLDGMLDHEHSRGPGPVRRRGRARLGRGLRAAG